MASIEIPVPHSSLSGLKILVTGAGGFIGSRLYHYLCETGAEVHAVSRSFWSPHEHGVRVWQGDLTDSATVRNLFRVVKPDIIFHMAGWAVGARDLSLVFPTLQSNLVTTVNVLTAATEIGCQRIVFPASLEEPDSEVNSIPSSPYAAAKWASRAYARMFYQLYQTPVVIVRVFLTYGPGPEKQNKVIPYVIRSLLQGEPPKLTSGQRLVDWIYIDDVVSGLIAAAQAPGVEGDTIDLGSGILVSIQSTVQQIVRLVGTEIEPMFGALPDRTFEQVKVADTASAYAKLGWQPLTSLEKGLECTVAWYKEQMARASEVEMSASRGT